MIKGVITRRCKKQAKWTGEFNPNNAADLSKAGGAPKRSFAFVSWGEQSDNEIVQFEGKVAS